MTNQQRKIYQRKYFLANREKRLAYQHEYYLSHKEYFKEMHRLWRITHRAKLAINQRKYLREHPKQAEKNRQAVRRWWREHPNYMYQVHYKKPGEHKKYLIRLKTRYLKKQLCWCGEKGEGHHPDYNRPHVVEWLCRKHHAALHRKLRQIHGRNKRNKIAA